MHAGLFQGLVRDMLKKYILKRHRGRRNEGIEGGDIEGCSLVGERGSVALVGCWRGALARGGASQAREDGVWFETERAGCQ